MVVVANLRMTAFAVSVPLTVVSKCLALLGFIYLFVYLFLLFYSKAQLWLFCCCCCTKNLLLQVSYFVLLLNSTPAMKAATLSCLIRFLRALLPPSLPCVLNIVSCLEFSKAHEKSAQISCSSWNFPGTEALSTACLACCMWESLCISWEEALFSPHCRPCSRLGVLFTATWTWSCTAKHASSFSSVSLLGQSHYNKVIVGTWAS